MENTVMEILAVAGLFVIRIGLPVAILLTIGALIENSYRRRAE
jgi:hypothetical protein